MSAKFIMTTSSYLANAAPFVITYPITVGMWVNLDAAGTVNRNLWALSDTGTSTNFLRIGMNTGETAVFAACGGSTEAILSVGSAFVPKQWHFLLGRFIASDNRRFSVLNSNGRMASASQLTAINAAGLDLMTLGNLSTSNGTSTSAATIANWDGNIAEFWYANTDVKVNGGNLTNNELWKLAYEGPFSFPHIANSIIEYRGFRKSLASDQDLSDDVYWGGFGRPTWTNNRVTLGPHPPTTPWYPYGYPNRANDLIRRDVFPPGAAPAEVVRLRYPVRMDGIGYGGIFPGNRVS